MDIRFISNLSHKYKQRNKLHSALKFKITRVFNCMDPEDAHIIEIITNKQV